MDKISEKYSKNIFNFSKEIFPICRSLTGAGNRKTLKLIKKKFQYLKFMKSNLDRRFLIGKSLKNGTLKMHT